MALTLNGTSGIVGAGIGTIGPSGANVTGVVTCTSVVSSGAVSGTTGTFTGAVSGTTGTFSGDVDIADTIVHTGDTNTKIRFPAADTIAFETAGSERARITSTGFLGIGQASPDSPLEVVGTGPSLATIHKSNGATNDEARLILGALSGNQPDNRGAGIAAVNNGAGHDLIVKCSASHSLGPTEKFRIKSGGDVSVIDGNLIIGTSGHGIDFSATADGNGTDSSELLDDYEEGTYTPTVHGWSAGGTASYNTQSGRYIKVGRKVTVWANLDWSSISGASGVHALGGLPYAHTSEAYSGACWVHCGNMGDDVVSGFIGNGYSSSILLYRPSAGAQDYMAVDTNGGYCKYTCTYIANV